MRLAVTMSVVGLLVFVSGCARLWELAFENTTGQPLVVTRIDGDGGETDYTLPVDGAVVVPTPTRLRIKHQGAVWDYELVRIPESFWSKSGVNRIRANLRVTRDGRLYLVAPKASLGVSGTNSQPEGYPLSPKQKVQQTRFSEPGDGALVDNRGPVAPGR
jgi:hypothetical protein